MSATTAAPVTERVTKKTTALQEENKRLKSLLNRAAEQLNSNLAIIGRGIGDKCNNCRGGMPVSGCFRCLRVVKTFGLLDDIDKELR